jgi:hypothetical protein
VSDTRNRTNRNTSNSNQQTHAGAKLQGVEITRITKLSPDQSAAVVSKSIRLQPDNTLLSDGSLCQIQFGWAERVPIDSVNTLARVIEGLRSDQAITLGRMKTALGLQPRPLASKAILPQIQQQYRDTISRSLEYFEFTKGPGIGLLDIDIKGIPDHIKQRIDAAGGIWQVLENAVANLTHSQYVFRNSTSSGIFRTNCQPHLQMTSVGGYHFYPFIQNIADFPRFLSALHDRLWLAGYGWYEVGKRSLLSRTLIDAPVGSPERLVFEANPKLEGALWQDPNLRVVIPFDGPLLDTTCCQDLHAGERSRLDDMQAKEKERLKPFLAQKRFKAEAEDAQKNAQAGGRTTPSAEDWAAAKQTSEGILLPNQVLPFDDPEFHGLTVRDVMMDPLRFIGATLADPGEGPAYGVCKAMIMVRAESGFLFVHSFAHGRVFYDLRWDAAAIQAAINAQPPAEALRIFLSMLNAAELTALDEIELVNLAVQRSGIGVQAVRRALGAARKAHKDKVDQALHEAARANRTDPRPQIERPGEDMPVIELMIEMDRILGEGDRPVMSGLEGEPIYIVKERSPNLFQIMDDNADPAAPRRPADPGFILKRHDRWTLLQAIEQRIDFIQYTKTDVRSVRLYDEYADHYLRWRGSLPFVKTVMTTPLVMQAASAAEKPQLYMPANGIDRPLEVYFEISDTIRAAMPQPEECTLQAAQQALLFLTDTWLVDVQVTFADKCVLLASVLQTLERSLLTERFAYLLTSGIRGAGKTTCITMLSLAVTGQRPPASPWADSISERRKDTLAYLTEGQAIIVRDNIANGSQISCPILEATLTSALFADRVLGINNRRRVSTETTVYMTANNAQTVGDLASRSFTVTFNVDTPHPEDRPFTHTDPYAWTLANRGKILHALYTLMLTSPHSRDADASTRAKNWWRLCGAPIEYAADSLPPDPAGKVRGPIDFGEMLHSGEDSGEALNEDAVFVAALRMITRNSTLPPSETGKHDWFTAADVLSLVQGSLGAEVVANSWAVTKIRDYTKPRNAQGENRSEVALSALSVGQKLRMLVGRPFEVTDIETIKCIIDVVSEAEIKKYEIKDEKCEPAMFVRLDKYINKKAVKKNSTGRYHVSMYE